PSQRMASPEPRTAPMMQRRELAAREPLVQRRETRELRQPAAPVQPAPPPNGSAAGSFRSLRDRLSQRR
ncbi:MAG: hypothetical protein R3D44_15180, partial [Hyphomicrobiaceae bacterium]